MNSETTYDDHVMVDASAQQIVRQGPVAAVRRAVRRFLQSMLEHHWERHTVRELSSLSPHMLRDIGVAPHAIQGLAADLAKERARQWAQQAGPSSGSGG